MPISVFILFFVSVCSLSLSLSFPPFLSLFRCMLPVSLYLCLFVLSSIRSLWCTPLFCPSLSLLPFNSLWFHVGLSFLSKTYSYHAFPYNYVIILSCILLGNRNVLIFYGPPWRSQLAASLFSLIQMLFKFFKLFARALRFYMKIWIFFEKDKKSLAS